MRRRLVALVALAAVGSAACGGGGDTDAAIEVPEVYDLDHDPTIGIAEVDAARSGVLPAGDLRLVLEGLFVTHGITLVHSMRGAERGDGSAEPWIAALVDNTDDITGAVGLLYGPVGADAFHQQWAQHTQFLVSYADALRRGDDAAADEAVLQLGSYAADSGSLLSTALGGRVSAEDAEALLATHVANMIEQIDVYHAGDSRGSVLTSIEDNAYLVGIAAALSGGFAAQQPEAFPGPTDEPLTLICSIAGRAAGDAALLALEPGSRTDLSQAWSTAMSDLDGALTDPLATGAGLGDAEQTALLDAISSAAAEGDVESAIVAITAWRTAVSEAMRSTDA